MSNAVEELIPVESNAPFREWHFSSTSIRAEFENLEERSAAVRHAASKQPKTPFELEGDIFRIHAIVEEWAGVLQKLALSRPFAERMARHTLTNGTHFLQELLVSGLVNEKQVFEAIAIELKLMFMATVDRKRLIIDEQNCLAALRSRTGLPLALLEQPDAAPLYVLARVDIGLDALKERLAIQPELAGRIVIAPPGALRHTMVERARRALSLKAKSGLVLSRPDLSAHIVATGWQGMCIGLLVATLLIALIFATTITLLVIQAAGTVAFLSCVFIRLSALNDAHPLTLIEPPSVLPADLPVYSVLVALYKEKDVIPQLLAAIGKIWWPHSKLEVKLVCEADDIGTLKALRAHELQPYIEIIKVPPGEPRTKPKALAYALPFCSGEYVTLFDAEDRPHPYQLLEAWRRFRIEDDSLACLQAPLSVTNLRGSFLARMFAFEYAALFRGVLPWLAGKNAVLPLGGTSNHFRRAALDEVGDWDPHNVTEDADLGLRLKRFGYRISTISLPTFEDAPEEFSVWMPQRVRWFKGWLQTWLVHMRAPLKLWREIGAASFIYIQILFLGTLISSLVHPLALFTVCYVAIQLSLSGVVYIPQIALAIMGLFSIVIGYGAFLALGQATLSLNERRQFWKNILLVPAYWLLLSVASWWAIIELYRYPHQWNKTPHRRARAR